MKLQPEEVLHVEIVNFLRLMCPSILFWHTPNENKLLSLLPPQRRFFLQKKMALLGVTAGVPDLVLHWRAPRTFCGDNGCLLPKGSPRQLYVELKAGKNKATPEQIKLMRKLKDDCGVPSWVTNSLKDFVEVLKMYDAPMKGGIYGNVTVKQNP